MMRTYVITNISEASSFDFEQLVDASIETSRKSLDGSKILARFEGDTPSFLIGEPQYTNEEILEVLSGTEWSQDRDI
jgi:hypothetical protein